MRQKQRGKIQQRRRTGNPAVALRKSPRPNPAKRCRNEACVRVTQIATCKVCYVQLAERGKRLDGNKSRSACVTQHTKAAHGQAELWFCKTKVSPNPGRTSNRTTRGGCNAESIRLRAISSRESRPTSSICRPKNSADAKPETEDRIRLNGSKSPEGRPCNIVQSNASYRAIRAGKRPRRTRAEGA